MTVYLVTEGPYYDRALRGVFSTREKAEAYLAATVEPRFLSEIHVFKLDHPESELD